MNIFRFWKNKKQQPFWPEFSIKDVAVLLSGLAVYAALVAATIGKFSIWFDEAFGSYLIRFDFDKLTYYTANDVHPPLYYWLLKLWSYAFGNTEFGLRSMSIFFGAVALVLLFAFLLRYFNRSVAYIALAFMVLSPMYLHYSQEARMYTLLTAIIIAATYLMVYAHRTGNKVAWIGYGVLVAAGVLTQYLAGIVWIAHWVWRFLAVRSSSLRVTIKKFFDRGWLLAHGVALLLFLPWVPAFIYQVTTVQVSGFWIGPVTAISLPNFLSNFSLFTIASETHSWFALALYALIIAYMYLGVRAFGAASKEQMEQLLFVGVMTVVPIIALMVVSMPPLRSLFVDRYLIGVVLMLPVLMALILTVSRKVVGKKVWAAVLGLTVILFSVGIYNQSQIGNYNKSSGAVNMTRSVVQAARNIDASVPIVANSPWIFYEAVPYEKAGSPVYFIDETTQYSFGSLLMLKEDNSHKIRDLDAFMKEHGKLWIIGNVSKAPLSSPRESWIRGQEATIDSYRTGKPVLGAALFSAE